jgi:hypothetical protein
MAAEAAGEAPHHRAAVLLLVAGATHAPAVVVDAVRAETRPLPAAAEAAAPLPAADTATAWTVLAAWLMALEVWHDHLARAAALAPLWTAEDAAAAPPLAMLLLHALAGTPPPIRWASLIPDPTSAAVATGLQTRLARALYLRLVATPGAVDLHAVHLYVPGACIGAVA